MATVDQKADVVTAWIVAFKAIRAALEVTTTYAKREGIGADVDACVGISLAASDFAQHGDKLFDTFGPVTERAFRVIHGGRS